MAGELNPERMLDRARRLLPSVRKVNVALNADGLPVKKVWDDIADRWAYPEPGGPIHYQVGSQSHPTEGYHTVRTWGWGRAQSHRWTCDCDLFVRGRRQCTHILAAVIWQAEADAVTDRAVNADKLERAMQPRRPWVEEI